jgi:hypothetical protein
VSDQLTTRPEQEELPAGEPVPEVIERLERPRSSGAAPVGWGIALIAAGVLWILRTLGVPIAWEMILPAGVIVIGIAILAGVRGALRSGLVGLGAVLAIVAVIAMAVPSFTFTAGDRALSVDRVEDVESTYEHGAGVLRLDLSGLELPEGTTEISARVNFGELVVIVPPDATVTGTASVRIGEVSTFGRTAAGFAPSEEFAETGQETARVLELDLEVGFGRVEVRR